jgi:Fe2+ or Zn2+ uptake regulation protein
MRHLRCVGSRAVNDAPAGRPDEREDALRDELLDYLREHPHAMDSLEGIAEWWLPRHQIRIGVERVSRAMERLAEQGIVERLTHGDRVWYRLRRPVPPPGS